MAHGHAGHGGYGLATAPLRLATDPDKTVGRGGRGVLGLAGTDATDSSRVNEATVSDHRVMTLLYDPVAAFNSGLELISQSHSDLEGILGAS